MATFHLGKLPAVHDPRTLRLRDYLAPTLPSPPPSVAYYQQVPNWPMYLNDQYGDCTCAAAGHMIQNWTANAGSEVTVPQSAILSFYEHFVGTPPPPDAGCSILSVLKYWRSNGLGGHTIDAFAAVSTTSESETQSAISITGGVYIGVALPDFCVNGDMLSTPWVLPPGGATGANKPNPNNGHCIPAVGYDDDQLWIVTWGELKSMSWEFYAAYADEAFALVSADFLSASGTTPTGLNLAALNADLAQL